jgi:hypothetical protein
MHAQDHGFEALLLTDELADGGTILLRSADDDFNIPESLKSSTPKSELQFCNSFVINQIKRCVFQIKF